MSMFTNLLDTLKDMGKITDEDLKEAELRTPNDNDKHTLELIHIIVCGKDHDSGACKWYEEENETLTKDTFWHIGSHLNITNKAISLMRELDIGWSGLYHLVSGVVLSLHGVEKEQLLTAIQKLLNITDE